MADLARLQFDFDSAPALRGSQDLDKLTAASSRTQKQMEQLAKSTTALAAAAQAQSTATQISSQRTLAALQAEQQLESLRLRAQITQEGRNQSLARLAQLGRDALSMTKMIAAEELQGAIAQDRYNASLQSFATVASRGIELQKQMAAANQQAINSNLGVTSPGGGADRTADIEAYGASLDALRAKYSPLFAASKEYEAALDGVSQAEKVGAINEHEAAVARENARLAFERGTVAANAASKGFSGAGGSLANLSFQINDIATGLASGQSPFQVLAQQGGQIFQIWQMNPGIFKESAAAIRGLITPATLAGGAVIGLGLAAAAAFNSYIESEKRLQAATQGLGAATGATVADLQSIAIQAAASGKITISQAEAMEAAYAKTGMVGKQNLLGLVSITRDFAAQTGLSVDDATARLGKMATDPMKGIDELASSIGGITGQTRELIQAQLAQGNQQRALTIFTDAARKSLVDYRANQTALQREGSMLWNGLVDGWHGTGKAISDSYDNMVKFNLEYGRYLHLLPGGSFIQPLAMALLMPPPAPPPAPKSAASINQAFGQLGNADQETGYDQLFAMQRKAGELQTALNNMKANPGAFSDTQVDRMTVALARQNGAISSLLGSNRQLITSEDVRLQQDQLTIRGLNARTPAEQAAIARQQTYLSLVGAHVTAEQRVALANSAAAVAYATAQKALDDQNKTIQLNIEAQEEMAKAMARGDAAGVLIAQAKYQALQEKVGNPGINTEIRQRKILEQTIGGQVDSLTAQIDTQTRLNAITKAANDNVTAGLLPFDRLNDAVQQNVQLDQLSILRKAALATGNQVWLDTIDQAIQRLPNLTKEMQANADQAARLAALNPNQGDIRLIQGLRGQQGGTAAIAGTSLHQQTTSLMGDLGQANPFGAGMLGKDSVVRQAQDELAQRQKVIDDALAAGDISWQQSEMARAEASRQAAQKIRESDQSLLTARMGFASDFFGQLATLSQSKNREIAAFGKAAAITQATIDGVLAVQKALAAYPPPFNFAMAAAVGAATAANVAQIAGFADGVVDVQGPGTGTSDSIPAWLSNGESVVTARATGRNRNTLAAMNAGASFDDEDGKRRRAPQNTLRDIAAGQGGGGFGGTNLQVVVENHSSAGVQVKQISATQVRVIVDERIAKHAPAIAGAAVSAVKEGFSGWHAQMMQAPRNRGRVR